MHSYTISILAFLLTYISSYSAVPPEVKQDYTPPKAKIGYGNTVFESANQYCMHCHYDLHDTWNKSMHANSWKDPIFQKLYQAFLKYMISNKLGKTGPTGQFTVETAKNVGKVCLGCHAPNALYSKDFKIEIEEVSEVGEESNIFSNFDPNLETVLYARNMETGQAYKIKYHIGNQNNREGINCALCHSIEEIKMAHPGDTYILSQPIKAGPIGNVIFPAGTELKFENEKHRNAFFKIVGPEIYEDYGDTRNSTKIRDGRFRIKPIPLDGQNGNTHYAGGPYYGPYGITAIDNVADNDETDRETIANTSGYKVPENHYEEYAKTLCLSCHQRSSGTIDKNPENELNMFMELCTTFNAIDQNPQSTQYTPKCTKCHMEARKGILINKWKKENEPWDLDKVPTEGIKDLMLAGIFYKLTVVPMHAWASDAYSQVNHAAAAILSGVIKSVVLVATFKAFYKFLIVYPTATVLIFSFFAILTMTLANFMALWQKSLFIHRSQRLCVDSFCSGGKCLFICRGALLCNSVYFYADKCIFDFE